MTIQASVSGGASRFLKPHNSALLMNLLAGFGTGELEALHRSDELEQLPVSSP
jgi:hypothetical protein